MAVVVGMMVRSIVFAALVGVCLAGASSRGYAEEPLPPVEMAPFAVTALFGANEDPAASFATVATQMRYTPRLELQSRGLPEAQSDIVIRGSMFEQTGMMVGAVPLFDPQTGHYTAEVPFAPQMLTRPVLLVGAENALHGFNSNIGTVRYGWSQVEPVGEVAVGAGTDAMRYGSFHAGVLLNGAGTRWAAEVNGALAEGDGTVAEADYRFRRLAARVQRIANGGQTDAFAGYLDKFYAWPGLYIGNAFGTLFSESDDYQTLVVGINHRQNYGSGSEWEAGVAFREMEDVYEVNRHSPTGNFRHLTRAWTAAVAGRHELAESWRLHYRSTLVRDDLVRSTSLTSGDPLRGNDFTERTYLHYAIVPEYRWSAADDSRWTANLGIAGDLSSQDSAHLGGVFKLEREQPAAWGAWTVALDVSQTSQVPGYTALRSSPNGLFGGNANLGREYASVVELSNRIEAGAWFASVAAFWRFDDDVVDWTWNSAASGIARQANPVEVDNFGIEWIGEYRARRWTLQASYMFLRKDPDYQTAAVDASYYILNYARHRMTVSGAFHLTEHLDLRMDAAWRRQEANRLRSSSDSAFHLSISADWRLPWVQGLHVGLLADNVTDSDFEYFPGTPAFGRHLAARLTYRW